MPTRNLIIYLKKLEKELLFSFKSSTLASKKLQWHNPPLAKITHPRGQKIWNQTFPLQDVQRRQVPTVGVAQLSTESGRFAVQFLHNTDTTEANMR